MKNFRKIMMLFAFALFMTFALSSTAYASSTAYDVDSFVEEDYVIIETGVTEDGIPFTVKAVMASDSIGDVSGRNLFITIEVERLVTFHFSSFADASAFRPPTTIQWSEGSPQMTGTLRYIRSVIQSGSTDRVVTYAGTLRGRA